MIDTALSKRKSRGLSSLCAFLILGAVSVSTMPAHASHIAGIRISQTGNTGLMINVDVTGFYKTTSTQTTMYLGTYYGQVAAVAWGDGSSVAPYGYGPSTGIPLVATSTVVNGVPVRAFRGSFSHTYGSTGSYTIAANTSCCPLTTPTYTLASGTILTTTFTTSTPFSPSATITTSFVQNTLAVEAAAPGFAKAFAPTSVSVGAPSTLTFTIDNTASTLDDNALAFADNLPAGLVVSTPANVVNTCTGGTVAAVSGTGVISYSGGVVDAGSTCTISVDVESATPGVYVNTSGDLISSFGNSGPASDTLTVAGTPPTFSKAFAPDTVGVNSPSTLTFTLDNTANGAAATAVDFTDNLPAGVVISTPANTANSCTGGTLTAVSGTSVISYTGGTIPASASCAISVDVESPTPGQYVNTTGDMTSSLGNSGTATDTLNVGSPPEFTKSFDPGEVQPGGVATLTFTIDNSANAVAATGLSFTDNLPMGMTVAGAPAVVDTCTGGTTTATPGSTVISYSGGTVAAGATCTIMVDVVVNGTGEFLNVSGPLSSSLGSSAAGTATASLFAGGIVDIPTLSLGALFLLVGLLAFAALFVLRWRKS